MHDSFASMYIQNMHALYECFTCVYVCVYAPLYMPDAHRGQKEVSGPLVVHNCLKLQAVVNHQINRCQELNLYHIFN